MIKAFLLDFSRVLLFPKDKSYKGELNALHRKLSSDPSYSFWDYFELDEGLFSYLHSIRNKHRVYMFTGGEVQNLPEVKARLDKVFKKLYSIDDVKTEKDDSKAYEYIARDIGVTPDEIMFIDDNKENTEAAKQAGCAVIPYKDFVDLREKIRKALEK